uniref:Uncharacterized protein n=1 Tax=Zea mays TaxID=4577 RepID=B6SXZ4_MAIZE|nr:hypothetical protein [Zea mays]
MMAMPTADATELTVEVRRAPDTASAEVAHSTTTAIGSSRLKPSASAGTWMRSASLSRPMSAARYDVQDRPRPAAPTTASSRMFPAAMNAARSPSSTRRYENEPPADGISPASSA